MKDKVSVGFSFLLLVVLLFSCSQAKKEENLPNIVWIIADDYSLDAGCYGNEVVKTPNIDRLAKEGMIYQNAFATSPVCSPSRSALYTGMYQSSIGAHQHRPLKVSALPDSVKVITHYLHSLGYFTSNGNGTVDSPPGKTDLNFSHSDSVFQGTDWSQREKGQPFFASVQFYDPHRPFKKDSVNPVDPDRISIPPQYPDHAVSRQDRANYLENVQHLDARVGKILDRLDKEGLSDNTVVFFFSDQGQPMIRGKCWLYDEGIQVPLIVRWPGMVEALTSTEELVSLIDVSATTIKIAGGSVPDHMHGVDFFSKDNERDYVYAGRNRIDLAVDHVRCVRSKKYKYIRNYMPELPYLPYTHARAYYYPVYTLMRVLNKRGELTSSQASFMAENKPNEEFYDLESDPNEIMNLVGNPDYQQVIDLHRIELNQWIEITGDVGDFDSSNYKELVSQRQEQYEERWSKRSFDPDNINYEDYLEWWEIELGTNR